jgi:hypothetical protein
MWDRCYNNLGVPGLGMELSWWFGSRLRPRWLEALSGS